MNPKAARIGRSRKARTFGAVTILAILGVIVGLLLPVSTASAGSNVRTHHCMKGHYYSTTSSTYIYASTADVGQWGSNKCEYVRASLMSGYPETKNCKYTTSWPIHGSTLKGNSWSYGTSSISGYRKSGSSVYAYSGWHEGRNGNWSAISYLGLGYCP